MFDWLHRQVKAGLIRRLDGGLVHDGHRDPRFGQAAYERT
jgi:hypothetical protein